jgi:putative membrane protein insertion efficiency factor
MILGKFLAKPLLGLVWLYRHTISPLLGMPCRFQPTCSEYATEALQTHGAFKGGWLVLRRIGRCHPWGGSGYDPVPEAKQDSDESD